jgi:hypothetical protein
MVGQWENLEVLGLALTSPTLPPTYIWKTFLKYFCSPIQCLGRDYISWPRYGAEKLETNRVKVSVE